MRTVRLAMSQISPGMSPFNRFCDKSSLTMLEDFPIDDGILPVNPFFEVFAYTREKIDSSPSGRVPVIKL